MSIAVIIPTRTISNVVPCIAAVREHEPDLPVQNIIVVDDSEGLDISRFCAESGVTWVKGEKPFIFARNVNIGIRAACDQIEVTTMSEKGQRFIDGPLRHDGVILLNDDALLQSPGGFTTMAQACEDYPEFGLIGATCNNVGNPNQFPKGIGLREERRTVCFVTVYLSRIALDAISNLQEEEVFTGYGMDDDSACLRLRKTGFRLGIHDGCYMEHGSLASTFRGPSGPGGDFRPNMKIFIAKYGVDNWGKRKEQSQFADLFP